jgi:hypothetical protein
VTTVRWEWIAIGYYAYLAVVALADRRFASARIGAFAATTVCGLVLLSRAVAGRALETDGPVFAIVVPLAVLLGGYWLSGLFFVRPMEAAEAWLMAMDERLLRRSGILAAYEAGPRVVHESLELAYVLVYAVIPAAVTTLTISGHADAISRFWMIVLLSEFISYGMMPWLQTRPPRVLESRARMIHPQSALRRFNASILDRGSIQANTIPSGHAAGAVATGLAVTEVMPITGIVFLVLATGIVAATVLGRYHYVIDSLLGVAVAVGVWYLSR